MSIKPSHLLDPVERMDTAELLSTIVERACLFVPGPKEELIKALKYPKEARTSGKEKEALTKVEKVPMVASNLVRFTSF